MKEKLKAAGVEIAFFFLTMAFLIAFLLAGRGEAGDRFAAFTVETGAGQSESAEGAAQTVDINAASAEELERLPGIGSKLAEEIVLWRQTNGPFMQKEDILLVDGVSRSVYNDLVDYITVKGSIP